MVNERYGVIRFSVEKGDGANFLPGAEVEDAAIEEHAVLAEVGESAEPSVAAGRQPAPVVGNRHVVERTGDARTDRNAVRVRWPPTFGVVELPATDDLIEAGGEKSAVGSEGRRRHE